MGEWGLGGATIGRVEVGHPLYVRLDVTWPGTDRAMCHVWVVEHDRLDTQRGERRW